MNKDTSGPAFPQPNQMHPNHPDPAAPSGMSLRDYAAIKAMQGMYANSDYTGDCVQDIAASAYAQADAMLKEREA